jgi:hypothetical protein
MTRNAKSCCETFPSKSVEGVLRVLLGCHGVEEVPQHFDRAKARRWSLVIANNIGSRKFVTASLENE